ncbi:hypothetical protein [Clostridium senegalense]
MKFYLRCVDSIYLDEFNNEWEDVFKDFKIESRMNDMGDEFPVIELNTLDELIKFMDFLKDNYDCGAVLEKTNCFNDGDYYTIEIYDGYIE